MMLANASALMQQGNFKEAAALLGPPSPQLCDPRVSLLLAGAYEVGGDLPSAEQTLQRAHTAWPANNSIAASLAREYMGNHQWIEPRRPWRISIQRRPRPCRRWT